MLLLQVPTLTSIILIDISSQSRCCIGGYYQTHKLSIILLTWFFVILKSAYKLFILISRNLVSRLILHGSITSSLWKGIASFSLYFGSINTSRNPDTSFKCFKLLHTTDLWSLITTFDKNLISQLGEFNNFLINPGYLE